MACHQMGARRPTVRDLSSMTATPQQHRASPAATTWFLEDNDGATDAAASSDHHFLDDCRMCGRYLPKNRDIYMYKGDTPFCSEDCRGKQIRIDEIQERANRRRRAAKVAAATSAASSRSSSERVESRTAAVAVGVV